MRIRPLALMLLGALSLPRQAAAAPARAGETPSFDAAGQRPQQPKSGAGAVHTPAPGSPERKAVLDALRAEMRRHDPRPVVFVVRRLAVKDGWAWLEAEPRSPDERSRYEPEAALLRLRAGRWSVAERMPAFSEREGTPLEEDCAYFARLRARFRPLPTAVLPPAGRAACPSASRRGAGRPPA